MPAHDSFDEKLLLLQTAIGDEQAFTQIFNAYHQQLGAFILRFTDSHELTQEIVQDVFMKIWTNRSVLKDIDSFKAYLIVIARNHAYNLLKTQARESRKKKEYLKINVETITVNEESNNWKEQHLQLIEEAIAKLPRQQQKIYQLSRNQGMKYEEIAATLGISFETVKKHMHLALRSIKNYVNLRRDTVMIFPTCLFFF